MSLLCVFPSSSASATAFPGRRWPLLKWDFDCMWKLFRLVVSYSWPLAFQMTAMVFNRKTEPLSVWFNSVMWLICCLAFLLLAGESTDWQSVSHCECVCGIHEKEATFSPFNELSHPAVVWFVFLFMLHLFVLAFCVICSGVPLQRALLCDGEAILEIFHLLSWKRI